MIKEHVMLTKVFIVPKIKYYYIMKYYIIKYYIMKYFLFLIILLILIVLYLDIKYLLNFKFLHLFLNKNQLKKIEQKLNKNQQNKINIKKFIINTNIARVLK